MSEVVKCCAEGLRLAVSDLIPEGFWIASSEERVVAAGKLTMVDIPREANTLHLSIEDFVKVKREYERTN